MIYLTQLIFIKEGKEKSFDEFEALAIPLMEKHGGFIAYRIRPTKQAFIAGESKTPYEIHFLYFRTEKGLNSFLKDEERKTFLHLKQDSVESVFIVKGEKMEL